MRADWKRRAFLRCRPQLSRPLSFSVTRATGSSWLRFCCFGAGVVSRGVAGQCSPRRESWGSLAWGGEPAAPCEAPGFAVVLGSVARTPEGAAVAAASVRLPPRRPRSSSQVCELPLGIAKRTRSQSVLARALATHYFKPAVLCEPLACIRSCIGSATIAVLAAHCSQRKRRA